MEQCSYLAFITDTWEETYKPSAKEAQEAPQVTSSSRHVGRPCHVHSHYTKNHPKWETHRRVFRARNHNTLPQIAGPWFPHQDNPPVHDFYCACMLTVLKPWRTASDLKSDGTSWSAMLEGYIANSPPII